MWNQLIGNHALGIFWCGQIWPWTPPSRSNKDSQTKKMLITRLLFVLGVWDGKPAYRKSWAGKPLVWSYLTLDLSFKVKQWLPNLKVLISCLLFVLEVWDGKPTYRKSWAGSLFLLLDLTLDPSFKVKQVYPNFKVLIARLWLVLEVCNVKPTYWKSWAGNLLMWSGFTLGSSFKVKWWLIDFLSGGYNLHQFSDALCLVTFVSFIKQHFVYLVSVQVATINT